MVTYETDADQSREELAAQRLATHFRGTMVRSAKYEPYDRVLYDENRVVCALLEIKCRDYPYDYLSENDYMLSERKVMEIRLLAGACNVVPLLMVACLDRDFMLDLGDDSYRVETRCVNDRAVTHQGVIMRDERMCFWSAHHFRRTEDINWLC